jgi:hypothetical protein
MFEVASVLDRCDGVGKVILLLTPRRMGQLFGLRMKESVWCLVGKVEWVFDFLVIFRL